MKRFKKVYLEITNKCNLNCSFCIQNKRTTKYLNMEEFKNILNKIQNYTDYLYFHIMGEPLLHPNINEFINYASQNFKVNITTNGYLINRIKDNKNIRQLNISLHSFNEKYNIDLDDYMQNIFQVIDSDYFKNTYISLRFWIKNKYHLKILSILNKHYHLNLDKNIENYTINNHIFINNFREFIWPDLDNSYYKEEGTCYAIKDHIGILSDGTIVPCCLDSMGTINLGNICNEDLNNILNSKRVVEMLENFKKNKKSEELCKHCSFIEK